MKKLAGLKRFVFSCVCLDPNKDNEVPPVKRTQIRFRNFYLTCIRIRLLELEQWKHAFREWKILPYPTAPNQFGQSILCLPINRFSLYNNKWVAINKKKKMSKFFCIRPVRRDSIKHSISAAKYIHNWPNSRNWRILHECDWYKYFFFL